MLTSSQISSAQAVHGGPGVEVYCSAAARLYSSSSGSWDYTGVCGVASLLIQSDIYYIKLFHIQVSSSYNILAFCAI